MKNITLYMKEDCPLCDDAHVLLQLFDVQVEERNIETKDEWTLRYGLEIPVIVCGDHELNGKDISFEKLSALLDSEADTSS